MSLAKSKQFKIRVQNVQTKEFEPLLMSPHWANLNLFVSFAIRFFANHAEISLPIIRENGFSNWKWTENVIFLISKGFILFFAKCWTEIMINSFLGNGFKRAEAGSLFELFYWKATPLHAVSIGMIEFSESLDDDVLWKTEKVIIKNFIQVRILDTGFLINLVSFLFRTILQISPEPCIPRFDEDEHGCRSRHMLLTWKQLFEILREDCSLP